jgi:hypothetical protein
LGELWTENSEIVNSGPGRRETVAKIPRYPYYLSGRTLYLDALALPNVVQGKSIYLEKSMKAYSNVGKSLIITLALVLMSATLSFAKSNDYEFKVHNNTKSTIKKMLVSIDGKKWGEFDIGTGIKAGATETLVWAKSTDNEPCEQYFKVQFADGEWSDATKFDFCEKGLVLEFN